MGVENRSPPEQLPIVLQVSHFPQAWTVPWEGGKHVCPRHRRVWAVAVPPVGLCFGQMAHQRLASDLKSVDAYLFPVAFSWQSHWCPFVLSQLNINWDRSPCPPPPAYESGIDEMLLPTSFAEVQALGITTSFCLEGHEMQICPVRKG